MSKENPTSLRDAIANELTKYAVGTNQFRIEYCACYYRVLYKSYELMQQRFPIRGWRVLAYGRRGHFPFAFVPPYLGDPSDFTVHRRNIMWNGVKPTGDPKKDFYYDRYYPCSIVPSPCEKMCHNHRFTSLFPGNNALWWEMAILVDLWRDSKTEIGKTFNYYTKRVVAVKSKVMMHRFYWPRMADNRLESGILNQYPGFDADETFIMDTRLRLFTGTPAPDFLQHLSYTFYEEDEDSTLNYPKFIKEHPMKQDLNTLEYLEALNATDQFIRLFTVNHPQFSCTDGSVFLPADGIETVLGNIVPRVEEFIVAHREFRKSDPETAHKTIAKEDEKFLVGLVKFINCIKSPMCKYRKDGCGPVSVEYVRYWPGNRAMGYTVGVRTPTDVIAYSTRDFKTVTLEDSKGRILDSFRLPEIGGKIDAAANRINDAEDIDL